VQNYGFASSFVCVRNLLCHNNGRNGLRDAEGGIWTAEGASDRGLERTGRLNVRSVMVCTFREIRQIDRACGTNGENSGKYINK
jgi:hypothetical protein